MGFGGDEVAQEKDKLDSSDVEALVDTLGQIAEKFGESSGNDLLFLRLKSCRQP